MDLEQRLRDGVQQGCVAIELVLDEAALELEGDEVSVEWDQVKMILADVDVVQHVLVLEHLLADERLVRHEVHLVPERLGRALLDPCADLARDELHVRDRRAHEVQDVIRVSAVGYREVAQLGAQLPEEDHAVLFEQSRAIGEDVVQPTAELRVEHEALPPLKRVEYLQKFRLPVVSNRLEIERHQATRACPVRALCAGAQARGGRTTVEMNLLKLTR